MRNEHNNEPQSLGDNASMSLEDLQWMAFRYVLDELSTEERGRFEELLAEDQKLRELVAETVAQNDLIELAIMGPVERLNSVRHGFNLNETATTFQESTANRKTSSGRFALPQFVFAASIGLVVLAAGWIWNNQTQNGSDINDLAVAWAEVSVNVGLSESAASTETEPGALENPLIELSGSDDQQIEEPSFDDESSDSFVGDSSGDADWMMVALSDLDEFESVGSLE